MAKLSNFQIPTFAFWNVWLLFARRFCLSVCVRYGVAKMCVFHFNSHLILWFLWTPNIEPTNETHWPHAEWKLVVWATETHRHYSIRLFYRWAQQFYIDFNLFWLIFHLTVLRLLCFIRCVCVVFGFNSSFSLRAEVNTKLFFFHSIPSRLNSICCLLTPNRSHTCFAFLCYVYIMRVCCYRLRHDGTVRLFFLFLSLCGFAFSHFDFNWNFTWKQRNQIKQLWLMCHTSFSTIVDHFQFEQKKTGQIRRTFSERCVCVCVCFSGFSRSTFFIIISWRFYYLIQMWAFLKHTKAHECMHTNHLHTIEKDWCSAQIKS